MNLDDPKLTAYALGEITDPAERSEIETWLAAHPEGQGHVAEIRELASFLSENLHASSIGLTAAQREEILHPDKIIPLPTARRNWSIVALTALAACLAAAPLLPWAELLRLRDSSAPNVAINDKPMRLQMPTNEPTPSVAPKKELLSGEMVATEAGQFDAAAPAAVSAPHLQNEQIDEVKLKSQISRSPIVADAAPASALLTRETAHAIAGFTAGWSQVVASERRGDLAKSAADSRSASLAFADKDGAPREAFNTEAYDSIAENDFLSAKENPLSTFSIDVDTASYANVRRFLNDGQLPPKGAVRIEELLNYFTYDYAPPTGDAPFSTNLEVADCPWQPDHRLVRIGLKGREIPAADRKPANLVFLIDVSGSMDEPNKLPLLKQSLRLLVDQLAENDRVAIAVYAGSSGLVLESTSNKMAIRAALENLQPGGSTNGASGIRLAYEQAVAHFQKDGVNRVILATDGDFNVGVTSQSDLVDLITDKAKSGVFLSVLGFGTGNVKDSTMEKLADKGNGNYAYIDSLREGKKVLVEQMGGTLITIAKDVKIQVEFNPNVVSSYRLIGYENRALKKEDFNNDKKDAGEIGSGHTVTALYEVVPTNDAKPSSSVDPLRYQSNSGGKKTESSSSAIAGQLSEMLTVKLRYKQLVGDVSQKLEFPLHDDGKKLAAASTDFRFASAVAEFAQLIRQSEHRQLASWDATIARANDAKGEDRGGYRAEFIELVKKARDLTRHNDS